MEVIITILIGGCIIMCFAATILYIGSISIITYDIIKTYLKKKWERKLKLKDIIIRLEDLENAYGTPS